MAIASRRVLLVAPAIVAIVLMNAAWRRMRVGGGCATIVGCGVAVRSTHVVLVHPPRTGRRAAGVIVEAPVVALLIAVVLLRSRVLRPRRSSGGVVLVDRRSRCERGVRRRQPVIRPRWRRSSVAVLCRASRRMRGGKGRRRARLLHHITSPRGSRSRPTGVRRIRARQTTRSAAMLLPPADHTDHMTPRRPLVLLSRSPPAPANNMLLLAPAPMILLSRSERVLLNGSSSLPVAPPHTRSHSRTVVLSTRVSMIAVRSTSINRDRSRETSSSARAVPLRAVAARDSRTSSLKVSSRNMLRHHLLPRPLFGRDAPDRVAQLRNQATQIVGRDRVVR